MHNDNGPDLPVGPNYPYSPEDVNGAVVEAVRGLDNLSDTADLSGRPIDATINNHQSLDAPIRFTLDFFLGGSSTIVIDQPAGSHERIEVETIKHAGVLYLQIIDETDGGKETSILSYRLRASDGSPAPAWLKQVGPMTFAGYPDANVGVVHLILSIVQHDGRVSDHELQLDTLSGHVSQSPVPQDHSHEGTVAPMFTQQMNEGSKSQQFVLLERASGFR